MTTLAIETEAQEATRLVAERQELQANRAERKPAEEILFWRTRSMTYEADASWVDYCYEAMTDIRNLLLQAHTAMKAVEAFPELIEPAREFVKDAGRCAHRSLGYLDEWRQIARTQAAAPPPAPPPSPPATGLMQEGEEMTP